MRVMRRRMLAKAAGFKLKKVNGEYLLKSRLSVWASVETGSTQGERDDAVLYLINSLRRWSYLNKRKPKEY